MVSYRIFSLLSMPPPLSLSPSLSLTTVNYSIFSIPFLSTVNYSLFFSLSDFFSTVSYSLFLSTVHFHSLPPSLCTINYSLSSPFSLSLPLSVRSIIAFPPLSLSLFLSTVSYKRFPLYSLSHSLFLSHKVPLFFFFFSLSLSLSHSTKQLSLSDHDFSFYLRSFPLSFSIYCHNIFPSFSLIARLLNSLLSFSLSRLVTFFSCLSAFRCISLTPLCARLQPFFSLYSHSLRQLNFSPLSLFLPSVVYCLFFYSPSLSLLFALNLSLFCLSNIKYSFLHFCLAFTHSLTLYMVIYIIFSSLPLSLRSLTAFFLSDQSFFMPSHLLTLTPSLSLSLSFFL
ncbi:unnamed protein product [Acanthosepion pharaonis]|uniref:Uncharacterized protein n=1 Tax=Acanthosepion pharaonis TaxID=158019 RepID=A0A812CNQ0_ACAPH|nr:unnamed protein product [Sepia pharaonis]